MKILASQAFWLDVARVKANNHLRNGWKSVPRPKSNPETNAEILAGIMTATRATRFVTSQSSKIAGRSCVGGMVDQYFTGTRSSSRVHWMGEPSAGRPSQVAAAKHVYVKMRDALPSRLAGIDDDSIAALGDVHLVRNLRGRVQQMSHQ